MKNFIMVQKELISKGLKGNSLNLFLMILERASLSEKNGWKDEFGRTYIIMRVSEICKKLSVCKRTASSLLNHLEEAALINRQKRGLGKPNLIFVTYQETHCDSNIAHVDSDVKYEDNIKLPYEQSDFSELDSVAYDNFYEEWWDNYSYNSAELSDDNDMDYHKVCDVQEVVPDISVIEPDKKSNELHLQTGKNLHLQKCKKLHHNNNINYNNIKSVNTTYNYQSYHQIEDKKYTDFISTFKKNIEFDFLEKSCSPELLQLVTDTVSSAMTSTKNMIHAAGKLIPKSDICRRLLELDSSHVEYVIDCIQGTSASIHNPKAYMLTCLYNAPETIDVYYMLLAQSDMNRMQQYA